MLFLLPSSSSTLYASGTPYIIVVMLAKTIIFTAAITTVVTRAEILKNNGLATEKSKKYVLLMPITI